VDLARKEKGTVSKGEKENSLVLPAASSPNIRIRISLLPNSLPKHCAYPEDDSRGGQDARGQVERKRKEGIAGRVWFDSRDGSLSNRV